MNVAFPAALLFLLALPGIVLRYAYRTGLWKNPFYVGSISDEVSTSVLFSGGLHAAWTWGAAALGWPVDFAAVLTLLAAPQSADGAAVIQKAAAHPFLVLGYFASILAAGYVLGLAGHVLVRRRGWDRRFAWLRYNNPWFYLLSGEILEFPDVQAVSDGDPEFDVLKVSVVIDQGGTPYLYCGRLVDYEFDRGGNLDRLILDEAARRPMAGDRGDDEPREPWPLADPRYYPIEGRFFVIRYADVRTLNVEFLRFVEEAPETDEAPDDVGTPRAAAAAA